MKKRIFVIVLALLLCVTASFAWLSNFESKRVKNINVGFDNPVSIAKLDLDASIEVESTPGVFEKLTDDKPFTFDKRQMIPDSVTRFKINVTNTAKLVEGAGQSQATKFKLAVAIKIDPKQAEVANLLDVLYLDVMVGNANNGANDNHVFVSLSEAEEIGEAGSGTYLFYVYDEKNTISVLPESTVTFDCYFYYSESATAKYQNKDIAISFRIE